MHPFKAAELGDPFDLQRALKAFQAAYLEATVCLLYMDTEELMGLALSVADLLFLANAQLLHFFPERLAADA